MKRILSKIIALTLLLAIGVACLTACEHRATSQPESQLVNTANYVVIKLRDIGDVVIKLDRGNAPITVKNFVKLATEGFYDGLTFHRVIANFMVQGGDPKGNGTGGSGTRIEGEFLANGHNNTLKHTRGVISMARGGYSYDSASSQFFICVADYPSLDGQYAAFGVVISGMEHVDEIVARTAHLATDGNGGGIPTDKRVVIETITALETYNA